MIKKAIPSAMTPIESFSAMNSGRTNASHTKSGPNTMEFWIGMIGAVIMNIMPKTVINFFHESDDSLF
jgi:hypothetical protein